MKCDLCRNKVEEHFLGKIKGTRIKGEDGKEHVVCSDCQREHEMEEIKSQL